MPVENEKAPALFIVVAILLKAIKNDPRACESRVSKAGNQNKTIIIGKTRVIISTCGSTGLKRRGCS